MSMEIFKEGTVTDELTALKAQLAARDAEIGRLRAALRMAKINPGVCTATPDGQLYEWAILHNASIESVLAPVAEDSARKEGT